MSPLTLLNATTCWNSMTHILTWSGPQVLSATWSHQHTLYSLHFMNVFIRLLNIPVNCPGNWPASRLLSSVLELTLHSWLVCVLLTRRGITQFSRNIPFCQVNLVFTIKVQLVWFLFPSHFLNTFLRYLIIIWSIKLLLTF